jgi:hypothetical protein
LSTPNSGWSWVRLRLWLGCDNISYFSLLNNVTNELVKYQVWIPHFIGQILMYTDILTNYRILTNTNTNYTFAYYTNFRFNLRLVEMKLPNKLSMSCRAYLVSHRSIYGEPPGSWIMRNILKNNMNILIRLNWLFDRKSSLKCSLVAYFATFLPEMFNILNEFWKQDQDPRNIEHFFQVCLSGYTGIRIGIYRFYR